MAAPDNPKGTCMSSASRLLQLTVFLALMIYGQPVAASSQLFDSHEIITLRLTSDFKSLFRDREARDYIEASLDHELSTGVLASIDLRIRLRGNYRAKKRNCRFPPLRLNFRQDNIETTLFEGQDILKLVTHCRDRDNYEEFALKEYLGYRAWNEVTDASFKVRLARITYIEASDGEEIATRYGYLVEHKDALAARMNATPMLVPGTSLAELDHDALAGLSLFQYFIGNTDWSTKKGPDPADCCHNVELLRMANGKVLPVPYDFDYSGLVNASYAQPAEELNLRSVRTRLYRGFCETNEALTAWVAKFLEVRPAINALFDGEATPLSDRKRSQSLDFLDGFYETVSSERAFERQVLRKCR